MDKTLSVDVRKTTKPSGTRPEGMSVYLGVSNECHSKEWVTRRIRCEARR